MRPEFLIQQLVDPQVIISDLMAHAVVAAMLKDDDIAERTTAAIVAMTGFSDQQVRHAVLTQARALAEMPEPDDGNGDGEDCETCPVKDLCPDSTAEKDALAADFDFAAFAADVLDDIDNLPEVTE
jgi:hypothetical protein